MADTSLIFRILGRDQASGAFNRVARAANNASDQATEVTGAFGGLRKSLSSVGKTGPGALGLVAAALAGLPAAANVAATGIVGGLGGGLAAVGIAAAAQSDKVQSHFTALKNHVVTQLTGIATPFEDTLVRISGMAKRTFNEFVPALDEAFQQMAPAIEGFADDFFRALRKLEPAIQPLTDAFTRLLEDLGPRLPRIFTGISNGLIAVANAVGENPAMFGRLAEAIGTVVSWGLRAIAFLTRFPGVAAAVVVVLGALAVAFAPIPIAIAAVIAAVVALATLVAARFPQIKAIAQNVWNWIKDHWHLLVTILTGPFGAAIGFIIKHWKSIKNGIVSGAQAVFDFVRSIPGKITDALGDLGSLLLSAGRSVIEGLKNGIINAVPGLRGTLSWVSGLIPEGKGPLREDRRLLQPAGRAIMGGLVGGIESQQRQLLDTLAGVSSQIARADMAGHPGAMAGSPRAMGGRRGRGGDQVTVRLVVDGADSDLKRMIRRMVRVDGGNVQTVLGSSNG